MLFAWLNRPHVREWWDCPPSLEAARREYLSTAPDAACPYVAYLDDEPVGYIQDYSVAEDGGEWWPDAPGAGVVGIDQFLADPRRLNQGLGAALISQFTEWLFRDPAVRQIRTDPRPDNHRAVRCYRKVGFQEIGPIVTPDGPALLMVLNRPATSPAGV